MGRLLICFLMIGLFSSHGFAQAKIFLDVGDAKVRKSKLAIPPFLYLGAKSAGTNLTPGDELFSVINNDLNVTGLFVTIDPKAYIEITQNTGLRPSGMAPNGFNFNNWKTLETEFLIRGGFQIVNGNLTLEIYCYYVPQGQLILGKKYSGPTSTVRKVAHTFTNDFIKAVTGRPGYFNSQIVVGIDSGPKTNREVYIGDWDGHNLTPITTHNTLTLSPAWSKNGEFIAYTAYVKRRIGNDPIAKQNPDLFMYELKTRRRWLTSYRSGINSGAEFMTDNKHLLLTLSQGRTADIYKMTLDGKSIVQLTQGPASAMNVEPAVSPDGKLIAFSSDRSGKPMIYTMTVGGGDVKRRTFAGNYNATPSWSPDGKKIAFAGFDNNKDNFDIFVMSLDGNELLRLSSARKANGKWANNEDPAYSPDGRQILFVSDRTGTKQLYMVNTDGTNERRITFDNKFYSKPKWGPQVE